jgi:hypothetical protein
MLRTFFLGVRRVAIRTLVIKVLDFQRHRAGESRRGEAEMLRPLLITLARDGPRRRTLVNASGLHPNLPERSEAVGVLPNPDGKTDTLLVGGVDKVWQYMPTPSTH